MKKLVSTISVALILIIVVSTNAEAASITDFDDLKTTDWYYAAVKYAVEDGLFCGTSSTTFSPDLPMTRGMFVTVLGRLSGVTDTYGRTSSTPFADVTQVDYFFPYAVWANDNGIVTGVGNNAFNPNGEITREQILTILYRYAEKYDFTLTEREYSVVFVDEDSVSDYAVVAMKWATSCGIINGSSGTLNPQGKASRAQVAQILLNFKEAIADAPENTEPSEQENPADWESYNPTYTVPTGKSASDAQDGYYDYDLANEIMAQVNTLRVSNGLDALLYHPKMQEWASVRAQEQIVSEGHTRPDGAVYSSVGAGLTFENITILRGCSGSTLNNTSALAERAVNNWCTSTSGHREAMLSSSSGLGAVSCYVRGDTVFVVHLFSNRTPYYMDFLIQ